MNEQALWDRLAVEHAVAQAPMGGGIAGARLASAVARAGGLGFVGMLPPAALAAELRRARRDAGGGAVGAGLLVPFLRRDHARACIAGGADAVLVFAGSAPRAVAELRAAGIVVLHQVGSPQAARRALRDGADALVAQGVQAGGHVVGTAGTDAVLASVRAVAGETAVLGAGGIVDADDARALRTAGAAGVLAGTRFLLTVESRAHPAYKAALLAADRTLLTSLFSLGWPLRHRVAPNRATDRWGSSRAAVALGHVSAPLGRFVGPRAALALVRAHRGRLPVLSPLPPTAGLPAELVEAMPLYAGAGVERIRREVEAAAVVAELSRGAARPRA